MTTSKTQLSVTVRVNPSLALIKYWGKANPKENTPATSSLAISLAELHTDTRITLTTGSDAVYIAGKAVSRDRFVPFFDNLRKKLDVNSFFHVDSQSNFPTAAGLASSSSGFAALAYGCSMLATGKVDLETVSALARLGSASAARAVYGGFTVLERNSLYARQIFNEGHWPELRVIIAIVRGEAKSLSSRDAMEAARMSSPLFDHWVQESEKHFQDALAACRACDLKTLGPLIRRSYLMMFSTMFTCSSPILYWEPESVALIKTCEEIRNDGLQVWETMDAGPQVKMLCLNKDLPQILQHLRSKFPNITFVVSSVGGGPQTL